MAGEWAVRGRRMRLRGAWIPLGTQLGRYERAWNFQFARLPSSSLLVLALWSEQVVEAEEEEAETAAWECRMQELLGL